MGRFKKHFVIFLAIIACFGLPIYAQKPLDYHFEIFGSKEGIPSKNLTGIIQDQQHFLWLGTTKGLYRFDGYDYKKISEKGSITSMALDQKGSLVYELQGKGLLEANLKTIDNQLLAQPNFTDSTGNNDHFSNVFVDSKHRIWANDFQNVKYYLGKLNQWKSFKILQNLASEIDQFRFFEDTQHQIWISEHNRLSLFDEKTQKPILQHVLPKASIIQTIVATSPQHFLIGTDTGELYLYDVQSKSSRLLLSLQHSIYCIFDAQIPTKGHFLIGTQRGLYDFDLSKNQIRAILIKDNFIAEIKSIIKDSRNNCFWMASSEGLIRCNIQQPSVVNIKLPAMFDKSSVVITKILQIDADNYFLGLSNLGMLRWNKAQNSFRFFQNPSRSAVTDLAIAPNNDLIIACSNGLYRLPPKGVQLQKILPKINTPVQSIAFDAHQQLWVSTEHQAIQVFDYPKLNAQKLWNQLPSKDFWKANLFQKIVPTPDGKVWLLAWFPSDYGVCYFDEKNRKFQLTSQLPVNNKHLDGFMGDYFLNGQYHQHQLIATGYGGLNVFDKEGKILHRLSTDLENSIFESDRVQNLAIDQDSQYWLGTNDGLYWQKNSKDTFIKFGEQDGLTNNDLTNGFLLNTKQELLIGQKNNIDVVALTKIKKLDKLDLFLTDFKVLGGRNINITDQKIKLERNENSIELAFSSLNFDTKQTKQFRYRLNKSQNWIDNGIKNKLTLVGLSPGDYDMEVVIGNNQGEWLSKPIAVHFEIIPFFTETIWFKLLIVMALASVVYLFYRFRLAQLLRLQSIRTEISADLHDDVGATLSSISILSTLVKNQIETLSPTQKYLDTILSDTLSLQNKLEEIIWNLRTDRDTVGQFGARVLQIGTEIFEASGIDYSFDFDEKISHQKLSMEFRRNLLLITKEAVNNLIKYSQCTKAKISLTKQQSNLILEVIDNGKGFDLTAPTGNGLGNMQRRAAKIKGTLTVKSIVGVGTTVRLVARITQMSD